jgi:hypothetical protein
LIIATTLALGCGTDGELLAERDAAGAAGTTAGSGALSAQGGTAGVSASSGGRSMTGAGRGGMTGGSGRGGTNATGGVSGSGAMAAQGGGGGEGARGGSGAGQGGSGGDAGQSTGGAGGDGGTIGLAGQAGEGATSGAGGDQCGAGTGMTCDQTHLCLYADGKCGQGEPGTCELVGGAFCNNMPVCGCDQTAYASTCRAWANGVDTTKDKSCVPGNGAAGDPCFVDGDCVSAFKCCSSPIGVVSCTTPVNGGCPLTP